jgi:hypothetical protein
MTAIVILNVVFAALVVVGIVSLLGGAIVSDRRASGARMGLEREVLAVRRPSRAPSARWGRRLDPAV